MSACVLLVFVPDAWDLSSECCISEMTRKRRTSFLVVWVCFWVCVDAHHMQQYAQYQHARDIFMRMLNIYEDDEGTCIVAFF